MSIASHTSWLGIYFYGYHKSLQASPAWCSLLAMHSSSLHHRQFLPSILLGSSPHSVDWIIRLKMPSKVSLPFEIPSALCALPLSLLTPMLWQLHRPQLWVAESKALEWRRAITGYPAVDTSGSTSSRYHQEALEKFPHSSLSLTLPA